jgi:Zn-dependent protease
VFDFDPVQVLVQYFCLLFSLCVHEAAHAAMANYCGDPSARLLGRLTLDPRKHIDPIGTVAFPLLAMITGIPYLFGWAKPVPFNPRNLNNARRDPVLIAMAGPASNLLIALAVTLLLRFLVLTGGVSATAPLASQALVVICMSMAIINLVLMLFNLIPVPPLDGHYVVRYFLSPEMEAKFEQIGPFGIIFVILFAGKLISVPLNALLGGLLHYVQFGIAGIL